MTAMNCRILAMVVMGCLAGGLLRVSGQQSEYFRS